MTHVGENAILVLIAAALLVLAYAITRRSGE